MAASSSIYYQHSRYPEVEEYYDLHETLGSGGFAKVKLGVHKLTGEKVAVKIMNKKQLGADLPRVYREIRALKKLHHQHICQMFQVIETETMIYVVLEYCPGGEVFDYIVAKERLKESEARAFFRQIVSALMHVHNSGFIHRDLKPENLLLDEHSNVKLIDFGLVSEPQDMTQLLETCCGSPAYAAPELIKGGPYIGTKADVWSLGILLYALINGFLPFDDDHTSTLYALIQKGDYEITEFMSTGTIFMIKQLLQVNPDRRVTVERLLAHPWVMEGYRENIDWESKFDMKDLDDDCVSELAAYRSITVPEMAEELQQWKYDHITATYFLLLQQKLHGKALFLRMSPRSRHIMKTVRGSQSHTPPTTPLSNSVQRSLGSTSSANDDDEYDDDDDDDEEEKKEEGSKIAPIEKVTPAPQPRARRISVGQPMPPPRGEIHSIQKPPVVEKLVNPAVLKIRGGDDFGNQRLNMTLPPGISLTPPPTRANMPFSPSFFNPSSFPLQERPAAKTGSGVIKTHSYHANLSQAADSSPTAPPRTERQGSLSGSVDRLLQKMKTVLKRPGGEEKSKSNPRRIKGMFNLSTTSLKSEKDVITEVERVLNEKKISYTRKDFKFRCKLDPVTKRGFRKDLEFTLEICLLPNLAMLGVKRKRIRGDVWRFKEVCGEIFAATRL